MRSLISLLLLLGSGVSAQIKPSGPITQNTGGVCSQAVVAGGNVTITCQGLDDAQRRLLARTPELLNELLRTQIDQKTLFSKLDELLRGVKEIQKDTSPRKLTAQQRNSILNSLTQQAGKGVQVTCILGDVEGHAYAEELTRVLKEAGWGVEGVNQGVFTGVPVGVSLTIKPPANLPDGVAYVPPEQIPQSARLLGDSLIKAGIQISGGVDSNLAADVIELRIGRK